MTRKERLTMSGVLLVVGLLTTIDIAMDLSEGATWWHVGIEGVIAVAALFGVYSLMKGSIGLKKDLLHNEAMLGQEKRATDRWRELSQRYRDGLSESIDQQFEAWALTPSEKEVALLLIKGFSFKEIATMRQTAEKTTRSQAAVIYAKSGLAGRTQLSAFFLEDLLSPKESAAVGRNDQPR